MIIIITTFRCAYIGLRFNSHSFARQGMSVLLLHVRNEGERELGHMGSRGVEEEQLTESEKQTKVWREFGKWHKNVFLGYRCSCSVHFVPYSRRE